MAGQLQLVAGQDLAVTFPGKQCRRALFAQQQLLIARVPGDTLERLVLVAGRPEVVFREVGHIQFAGIGIDLDDSDQMLALIDNGQPAVTQHGDALRVAPADQRHFAQHIALQVQFDQERVLAHDRKQSLGLRVVDHVRCFILLHARQRLGIDHRTIVRQPDARLALGRALELFLHPEHAPRIPVHGECNAVGDNSHQQQPGVPTQGEARTADRFKRGKRRSGHRGMRSRNSG
ncbi:hypothetical protein D3C71_1417980 [compost metagenome]